VLQYPSLAGRPVWPARDRCEKPQPSGLLIAVRDPRRAHRSADITLRLRLSWDGRDLKNRRLEASISSRMKSERIAWWRTTH